MNAIRAAFFTQTAHAHQQNAGTPSLPTANNPGFATVAPTNTGSTAAATQATPASGTPSATNPTIPTATPGKPSTYTVHEGETAWCLARRFNVDPSELLDINAKPNNYLLMPGDILKIPTSAKTFPGDRALHTHSPNMTFTIPANLTNVYYVACWFGDVDPNAIIAANNLKEPYSLTPGKTVIIP
jgi:LysM repeat protein